LPVKTKTDVAVQTIGLYLAMNAIVFAGVYILSWIYSLPVGRWLELNRPNKPYVPGTIFVAEIFLLLMAYAVCRDTTQQTKDKARPRKRS
jgi:hypothetical protein